jgi:hypothetical protein
MAVQSSHVATDDDGYRSRRGSRLRLPRKRRKASRGPHLFPRDERVAGLNA